MKWGNLSSKKHFRGLPKKNRDRLLSINAFFDDFGAKKAFILRGPFFEKITPQLGVDFASFNH
jgi:hypothetical protein